MNKVAIITDSTADLSPELYKENNIYVVPLNVNFENDVYRDNETITPDELYAKVTKLGYLPKTSAISPQKFIDIFTKFINDGFDIVYIGIGSGFSSVFQNANIAKEEFPEGRIYLIDSRNLSSSTGLLVLKMAKYRDEGKSAEEIYNLVSPLVPNVSCQFAVDTLEYLYKGGRCSGASKLFGTLFHIHPIIKVVDGGMIVYKKPRGPYKVALKELVNEIANDYPNIDMDNIMVTHSGIDQAIIDYLKTEVGKIVGEDKIRVTRAGCVVSTHCGPSTIGVLYIKK